jgi:hypothetical protein
LGLWPNPLDFTFGEAVERSRRGKMFLGKESLGKACGALTLEKSKIKTEVKTESNRNHRINQTLKSTTLRWFPLQQ